MKNELEGVRAQLAEARRRLGAEKDRAKKAEARRLAQWRLDVKAQRVALILYDLSGYDKEAAVAFLNKTASKRKWPPRPTDELREQVRELFLQADLGEYAGLVDAASPLDESAMKIALQFWEEWFLISWTKDANRRKGVAPSAGALLQRLAERRESLPEAVRPPDRGSVAEPRARMWLTRWRRRWGAKHGTIRMRDDVGVEEMREKALAALLRPTLKPESGSSLRAALV